MSKPRARGIFTPYAVYYKDGNYLIFDLVAADYKLLKDAMHKKECVELSIGFFSTDDIRAVIEQKPKEDAEHTQEFKGAFPDLDIADMEWIKKSLAGMYGEGDF